MSAEQTVRSRLSGRLLHAYQRISLRNLIWVSFTLTATLAVVLIGLSFYGRLSSQFRVRVQEQNQALIEQLNNTLSSWMHSMMRVSDTIYYSAIKDTDFATQRISDQIGLLYDTNRDYIENIALYTYDGQLLESAPAAIARERVDVTRQDWFVRARQKTENLHFTGPAVQNLFAGKEDQYSWVISLSRAVQMTNGTRTVQGVLLVDLRYISLEEILKNAAMGNDGYVYLIDADGSILYHPKMQLIHSGLVSENNSAASGYQDGNHHEEFDGESRVITVKSVGYTGWKIIGVTPQKGLALNTLKSNIFFVFLALFFLSFLVLINSFLSARVTDPIRKIEQSVRKVEDGDLDATIPVEGCLEVRHLGSAIVRMTARIRQLMDDIVLEHESKRKGELDTLQSQINPHFLYNTLDIIVWMIENERRPEAVQAVTSLARFFRISLSRGKTIIPVADELAHVESYLTIQMMRFRDRFTWKIDAAEDVLRLSVIKLVLQPLVENAIYHGMEYMDGEGEILISAYREADVLVLCVRDNGPGMTPQTLEKLLRRPDGSGESTSSVHTRGSGIGVRNVHERIRLQFGVPYGLTVSSMPDEGTAVTLRLPAIPFGEEVDQR